MYNLFCTFLSCTVMLILIFMSTVYCHAHSFKFYILFFISYFLLISFYVYFLCVVFYNICTVHGADLTHISLLVIYSLYNRVCDKQILNLNLNLNLNIWRRIFSQRQRETNLLQHADNSIAQRFSKFGLWTGRELNPDPPRLRISSALVSLRPPCVAHAHARTRTRTRAHEPVLQCLQTLL